MKAIASMALLCLVLACDNNSNESSAQTDITPINDTSASDTGGTASDGTDNLDASDKTARTDAADTSVSTDGVTSTDTADTSDATDGTDSTDTTDGNPGNDTISTVVTLSTPDGKSLPATLHHSASTAKGAPGVILVHQFKQSQSQWDPILSSLTEQGFRVLTFDLRGHGASDPQDGSLMGLLTDPKQAPLDVQAAIQWLATEGDADKDRLAIIGTSIGANLACLANGYGYGVKLGVALSPRDTAIDSLSGGILIAVNYSGMYYVASDNDGNGAQAKTSQTLFEQTADPKKIDILKDSSLHGKAIVENHPEIWGAIVSFIQEHL